MASQIKTGAIISYASICLNMVLGLLYTPWMIRQIGTSEYGLYALSGTFIAYFMLDFGLGSAVGRFLAMAVAQGDKGKTTATINTAFRIYLIIDSIICALLLTMFFFIDDIFVKLTPDEIEKFKLVFCISTVFSILSFPLQPFNGTMISHEKFIQLKTLDLIQKVGAVLLTIGALLAGYGLYAVVAINASIAFLCNVYKFVFTRYNLGYKISLSSYDSRIARGLFSFSMWVFIISIAHRLAVTLSPTILGIRASTLEITIYSVASTLEAYVWTFSSALNGLFLPRVSSMVASGSSRREITDLMIRVGRIQLIICGLIISGLIAVGKPFLNLWMGPDFEKSYYVVVLMVATGVVSLTQAIAATLLDVENEIRWRAFVYCGGAVISFIVGMSLAGELGALGCGIGIFVSLFMTTIGMNIIYVKKLKLEIGRFFRECHLRMMLPMLICLTACLGCQELLPPQSWLTLLAYVLLYSAAYVSLLWIFSLNKSEKDLLMSVYHKIVRK